MVAINYLELLTASSAASDSTPGFVRLFSKSANRKLYVVDETGAEALIGPITTFLAENGSVSAPSYSFSLDTNTGLWRVSTGCIGVSGDGLEIVRFQAPGGSNPQVLIANGSATVPSLGVGSDTGTGIYKFAASALGVAAAGRAIARFVTDGANDQLIVAAGSSVRPSYSFASSNSTGFYQESSFIKTSLGGAERWAVGDNSTLTSSVVGAGDVALLAHNAVVNKASGNYTGYKLNVTETAAPGTNNKLLDLQVGSTSLCSVSNAGELAAVQSKLGSSALVLDRTSRFVSTDATANQTVLTIAIPDQVNFVAEVDVIGSTADGATYGMYTIRYSGFRNAGGNVTVLANFVVNASETDAGLNAAAGGSAANFVVVVTGLLATTIYWETHVRLTYGATA